jgi:cytochrome P450
MFVKQAIFNRLQKYPTAFARMRDVFSRHRLPPGKLVALDLLEKVDRGVLRKRADELGPVFKGIGWGELCICIVGLDRCREITQQHGSDMQVISMDIEHLIPEGLLHKMEGDQHRHYRRATMQALHGVELGANESVLESIAGEALRDYVERSREHKNSASAFTSAMSTMATSMVTWLFFGAEPGTPVHERILAHFRELGPYGLVWNPQKRQENAFRAFRDDLRGELEALRGSGGNLGKFGMLAKMVEQETLDDTLLGNLIYQAEMGRSDLKNWFRWLTRHVSDDPAILKEFAADDVDRGGARPLVEAFVLETLRTDQSERLMRRVVRDFVYEGFLFPQFATVRLCLWESHHAEDVFEKPHRFDPKRFVAENPGKDRFAPFGVDHHQCPMGSVVIRVGMVFLRMLARGYDVRALSDGREVRGGYHWEPAPGFAVELKPL